MVSDEQRRIAKVIDKGVLCDVLEASLLILSDSLSMARED